MDEEASIAAALEAELASVNTPVLSFSRPDSAVLFSGSSLPRLLWSARRKHRSSEEVSPEAHNRLTRCPSSEEVVSHPHSRARHYQGSATAFVPGSSVCRGAERPSEASFGLEKDARAPPHRRTSKLLSRERSPQNDVGYMHAIYAPTAEIESILGDTSAGPRVASGEIWDPSSTFCSPIASDRDGKLEGKTEDEQDDGGLAELLSVQSEIQRQLVRVQEAMLSDCRVFSSLAARVAGGARSLQNPGLYRKQLARHTRNKSTTPLFVPFRPLNQQQRTETRHATHSSVFEGRSGDPRLPYVSAAAPAPRFLCTSPSSGVSRIKRVSSARAAQAEQYNRLHLRVTNSARPDAATGRFSASTPVAASPQMNQVGRKRVRTADDVKTHFFFHPKSGGGDVTTTRAQNISRAKRRNRRHSFSADDLHSLQSGANGRRYDADSSYGCPPSFPHPRVFSQSKSPQSPRPSKHARRPRALAGERERSANSQNAPECALATLNGFLEACREAQETDYGMGVSDRHAFRLRNCDEELPAIVAEANRGRVGGTCVSEEYDRRQGTNNSAETEDFGEVEAPHLVRSQLASLADSSALGAPAGHGHPGDAMSSQKFPSVSPSCMSREHYSTACPSRFSSSVADSAECPQNARHRDQKKSTFDIERDK
uniref:Uncharacterized protein n=1 Tax=Toxoplasma gondii (strain ATCC 50861 / VEG) TaxID=432359 RepID=A0A0F7UPC5_TOXGV|nr:TPA: hypothetical protein BN1205_054370 [Toxoplasma gondii VEG]